MRKKVEISIESTRQTIDKMNETIHNLSLMEESPKNSDVLIKKIKWCSPLSILPLVVFSQENQIKLRYTGKNLDIKTYLKAIDFPDGTENCPYNNKRYLPISKIVGSHDALDNYEDFILDKIKVRDKEKTKDNLKWFTSEIASNIFQHSGKREYWINAQYWKKTKVCEICMIDTGCGFKSSYKGTKHEVETDEKAIWNALIGRSSKKDSRGSGIPTIYNLLIKGYDGELIILSGNSYYYLSKKETQPINFPFYWQGSIILKRFKVKDDINFYDYVIS